MYGQCTTDREAAPISTDTVTWNQAPIVITVKSLTYPNLKKKSCPRICEKNHFKNQVRNRVFPLQSLINHTVQSISYVQSESVVVRVSRCSSLTRGPILGWGILAVAAGCEWLWQMCDGKSVHPRGLCQCGVEWSGLSGRWRPRPFAVEILHVLSERKLNYIFHYSGCWKNHRIGGGTWWKMNMIHIIKKIFLIKIILVNDRINEKPNMGNLVYNMCYRHLWVGSMLPVC